MSYANDDEGNVFMDVYTSVQFFDLILINLFFINRRHIARASTFYCFLPHLSGYIIKSFDSLSCSDKWSFKKEFLHFSWEPSLWNVDSGFKR